MNQSGTTSCPSPELMGSWWWYSLTSTRRSWWMTPTMQLDSSRPTPSTWNKPQPAWWNTRMTIVSSQSLTYSTVPETQSVPIKWMIWRRRRNRKGRKTYRGYWRTSMIAKRGSYQLLSIHCWVIPHGKSVEQEDQDFDIENVEDVDQVDADFNYIALMDLEVANDPDALAQNEDQTDNVDVGWWVTVLVRVAALRAVELMSELCPCQSCCLSCYQSSAAVRAAVRVAARAGLLGGCVVKSSKKQCTRKWTFLWACYWQRDRRDIVWYVEASSKNFLIYPGTQDCPYHV